MTRRTHKAELPASKISLSNSNSLKMVKPSLITASFKRKFRAMISTRRKSTKDWSLSRRSSLSYSLKKMKLSLSKRLMRKTRKTLNLPGSTNCYKETNSTGPGSKRVDSR